MTIATAAIVKPLVDPAKFRDPDITAKGEQRAVVALTHLRTLWFNTGSLCNITCQDCFMESSPKNDKLAYLRTAEIKAYLDESEREGLGVREIGLTGGEPFMNPDIMAIIASALGRGYDVLVLTNAMKPMARHQAALAALPAAQKARLTVRVSLDHYTRSCHEDLRGAGTWDKALAGFRWLVREGFNVTVAGRTFWNEDETFVRGQFKALFDGLGASIDTADPGKLVLFPEMDERADVPEITVSCWNILGVNPESIMCATARMVIKRKGAAAPVVVPCTLLPYDPRFEMGEALSSAPKTVKLNHPHCAKFCVLGGASCSAG